MNNILTFKNKFNPNIHGNYESEPEFFITHDGCKIDNNTYIRVDEYIQYEQNYFDIILHKEEKEIIIGRYLKDFKNIMVAHKNNKILFYYAEYAHSDERIMNIVKIINLYNLEDDVFYSVTEKEALNLFDSSISDEYLQTPDDRLLNYNINNKQKTMKKGISRFCYYGD